MMRTYFHNSSPEVRDIPVLSDANNNIEVPSKLVSGIEGYPPEAAHELAVTPESWSGNAGCPGCEERDESASKKEGKADTSTDARSGAISDADAESLGDSKADSVDEVAWPADLICDVAATVEGCSGEGLTPYCEYVSKNERL
jgi:hypothetical protein